MSKQKKNGVAEGEAVEQLRELTPEQVEKYLKKDLTVAISCLEAILRDQDILSNLAVFMAARFNNAEIVKHARTANVD